MASEKAAMNGSSVIVTERGVEPIVLALFDAGKPARRWPDEARRDVQLAANYYAAALSAGTAHPDRAGRDAVLAAPIAGLDQEQQCLVASLVAFQRERLRLHRELAYLRLNERDRELALQLSAVLALGHALSTAPRDALLVQASDGQTTVLLDGDQADRVLDALAPQIERWRETIGPLDVRAAASGELAALHEAGATVLDGAAVTETLAPSLNLPGELRGDEPITEGARRILRRMFEKMLAREEEVLGGEDAEDVHQMRVATRRLRASLQIVEPFFDTEKIRDFRRGLRRVAASLGSVRDDDVFLIHVREYQQSIGDGAIDPLIAAIERERAEARVALIADLESRRYARFKRAFARFLTTPGACVNATSQTSHPPRVRDAAGSLIYRRYEDLRAFEVVVPDGSDEDLHQARIAGKRLRYTLEFFADALGPKVDDLLTLLAALQENLGAAQDSVVARARIHALGLDDDPGAQDYLAARASEHTAHLGELPRYWEKVNSSTFRRKLFELIIKL
jgi:CHAD domain-containing protein